MRRRLFTILSALSLVLCVASCALWVRCRSSMEFGFAESSRAGFSAKAKKRGVEWMIIAYRERRDDRHKRYLSILHSKKDNFKAVMMLDMTDDPILDTDAAPNHLGFGFSADEGRYPRLTNDRMGFHVIYLPPDLTKPADYRYWYLATPYWALILLLAILPTMRILQWRKKRTAISSGHCLACGYDLRATPARCPECGTETKSSPAMAIRK